MAGSNASAKLRRTAKQLRTIPEQGVAFGAKAVRDAAVKAARSDTGGDLKLSGLKNGKALTVTTKKHQTGALVVAEVKAGPQRQRAPWFWLEAGTRAGQRPRRRKGGGQVMYRHPGTRAKRTWSKSVGPALTQARSKFEELHRKAMDA